MFKVFIDGEVGTTGLQIRDRLARRDDIEIVSIAYEDRKNFDARIAAFEAADFAVLCLPDAAVHEVAPYLAKMDTRIVDASTAHRIADGWVFGFAELSDARRDAIAKAQFVSNPGCYSTGAIALLHPLVEAGLIASDAPIAINAISGYTGGGKALVEEYEGEGATANSFVYATAQGHKHIPEIVKYAGLDTAPIFVPSVGPFAQGMIVQIPLPFATPEQAAKMQGALADHYAGSNMVKVVDADAWGGKVDPRHLADTNGIELSVHGDIATGRVVLMAMLDNLGKGASGAAVQNLNIMMGLDETTGL